MVRRNFLTSLLSLPILRWIRPREVAACACCDCDLPDVITFTLTDGDGTVIEEGIIHGVQPWSLHDDSL